MSKWFKKGLMMALVLCVMPVWAQDVPALSSGQTLYLPIYSHLYHGEADRQGNPALTLASAHVSIRNTDANGSLKIVSARYYDTNGKLIKEYLPKSASVGPYGTYELFVPNSDQSGGSGANFIIVWSSSQPVNPPIVEALHAEIRASRSITFLTTARPVRP